MTKTTQNQPINHDTPYMEALFKAIDAKADIVVIENINSMIQENRDHRAKTDFFEALSNFQFTMPLIHRSAKASFPTKGGNLMQYSFATLDDVVKGIKDNLKDTGLSYRFQMQQDNHSVAIKCIIAHSGGHQETCTMTMPIDGSGNKNDLQRVASTVTYLKRYALCAALGIATSDDIDDAQSYGAMQQQQQQQQSKPPEKKTSHKNYHRLVEEMIKEKSKTIEGYEEKILQWISQQVEREIQCISELTVSEIKKTYNNLIKTK
jgi:hypothetical protein